MHHHVGDVYASRWRWGAQMHHPAGGGKCITHRVMRLPPLVAGADAPPRGEICSIHRMMHLPPLGADASSK